MTEHNVDGMIEILFVDGDELHYDFKNIKTWHINDGCLWIEEDGHRRLYPLGFVKSITVVKNTKREDA